MTGKYKMSTNCLALGLVTETVQTVVQTNLFQSSEELPTKSGDKQLRCQILVYVSPKSPKRILIDTRGQCQTESLFTSVEKIVDMTRTQVI